MKNDSDDKNNDPITGVFLFGKEVKNDGEIISKGARPITHIQADKYSGKGSVKSIQTKAENEKWFQKWWIKYLLFPLVVLLLGGFIIFKLGWT